jgi:uncharacterized protein
VLYAGDRAMTAVCLAIAVFLERTGRVSDLPSPCIGVCRLDPGTGLCAGCMRTLAEIAAWPGADDDERLAIVQRLRARRRAAGRTSAADSRPRRRRRASGAG